MPTAPGLRVRTARGVKVAEVHAIGEAPRGRRGVRAGRGAAKAAAADPTDALVAALEAQELRATHELSLRPAVARGAAGGRRGIATRATPTVALDVDVAPGETAVVLLEQDGEYSWHVAPPQPEPAATPRRGVRARGVRAAKPRTTVTITVALRPAPRPPSAAGRRGFGLKSLIKGAKAIVLKFVAHTTAGVAMRFLERNVRPGLVVMDSDDVTQWRNVERLDDLALPAASPATPLRVLLWVHGTFSSTRGAFAALTSTPEGKAFLAEARGRYDVLLGYDHRTLSEDPLENAVDLVERLGRFARPMRIDAITHSRGGLVYRSMVEHLLPKATARPQLGPAIFAGVPNAGTLLARAENWSTLLDLYTNLAVSAFRLLQLVPAAAPAAGILGEIISGLGAFVKYLAEVVVKERRVPGLAAMDPGGEFVRRLNATGDGQPLPDACRYLAITSNFDPAASLGTTKPTGLAASFAGRLANGFIDRLFGETNDLVVNDGSMKRIDEAAGPYVDGALDFGDSPVVYHTVYFAQPEVAQNLRVWLLDEAARRGIERRPGAFTVFPSSRSPFTRVRYHKGNVPALRAAAEEKPRRGARAPGRNLSEAAERHLESLFGVRAPDVATPPAAPAPARRGVAGRRAAAAPPATAAPRRYAPRLVETGGQVSRLDERHAVHLVSYQQLARGIPVFGTRAVVELDDDRQLVGTYAKIARVGKVAPTPTLTPAQALDHLAKRVRMPADVRTRMDGAPVPPLTYYHDRERDAWHLAYVFAGVPGTPLVRRKGPRKGKQARVQRDGHGIGPGPRQRFPRLDYLVDAHDGALVYYYSVTPTASAKALPGMLHGTDEEGVLQTFFGLKRGNAFRLEDPQRFITTMDLRGGDIDTAKPAVITSKSVDFADHTAAVSAHVNATHVFDFYNGVLIRRGIDDNHMPLENVVNCVSPADEDPPQWANAVWWNRRMWYGQVIDAKGRRKSLARWLDIIGHELTHGVIETTCDLVYRDEAGALNESFADIFGVMIANRVRRPGADPRDWDWHIGAGLGEDPRKPLRDMRDPTRTGDPAHVRDMFRLQPGEDASDDNDWGGVHTNSNIHNKAAYNLLTATRKGAKKTGGHLPLVFTPDEVARLFYFTMQRIDRVATFEDVYWTMLDVARTVYPDPKDQPVRLEAITRSYAAVGVPRKRRATPSA